MPDHPFALEMQLAKRMRAELEERSGVRLEMPLSGLLEQVAAEALHAYGLECSRVAGEKRRKR